MTTIPVGQVDHFSGTAYLDGADTQVDTGGVITWSIGNPAVATVQDNGSVNGVGSCVVTAVAPGTTSLMCIATDADGHNVDSILALNVPTPAPPHAVAVVITQV